MLENPRVGVSQGKHFIFIEKSRLSRTPLRKPATRVFQHFSFRRHDHAEPIRRSVVTRPKVKRAEQEKCDSRLFAIACKPKACVPPQAGFARLGLFAVGYLMCPHPTKTQNTFGHIFLKTLGKFLKPTSNPHYYKKTEFWKKCVQHNKTPISGYF